MLLPRILTAVLGVPVLLAVIWFGGLPFYFALLAITLVAMREFYYLAEQTGYPCYTGLGVVGGGLVLTSMFFNGVAIANSTDNQVTAAIISLLLLLVVLKSLAKGPSDTSLSEWGITLLGILYVAWSLGHLLLLRDLRPYGFPATCLLFAIIWTEDTAAYFVGMKWGRRRIAESISPKKTWEGTIAGVFAAMAVAALFQVTVLRGAIRMPEILFLAGVTAILGFCSDLGESMIKRGAGLKDSSLLLPGHGGLLDRFDAFVLTAPFFYYYWAFLKH
jgi:phosphatidate cytidylyltransferase